MVTLVLLLVFVVGVNALLIWRGKVSSAIVAALFNGIPIGLILLIMLSSIGHAWYIWVTWIAVGLLVIGFIVGLVLRFWNIERLIAWFACLALVIAGIWGSSRYDRYLSEITLHDYFNYRTYLPFKANSPVKTLDEESTLKFTDLDTLPRMDGATALYPVYAAFVQAVYPLSLAETDKGDLAIEEVVACSTTSSAYQRLIDGRSDIGPCDVIFAAGPSEEQEAYAAERGVELVYTPIGREAFVFFVHPDNPIDNLSLDQIRAIYSGETTNWDQLGVQDLGKIRAYQREKNSGSQTALERFVMGDTPLMPAETELVQAGMGDMVEQVSAYKNHRNAIGYSFRFYCTALMQGFDVKLLSINGVEPTVENIENGSYPLASDFYAVTRSDADENTLALVEWAAGPQGQELVEKTGYTPYASK